MSRVLTSKPEGGMGTAASMARRVLCRFRVRGPALSAPARKSRARKELTRRLPNARRSSVHPDEHHAFVATGEVFSMFLATRREIQGATGGITESGPRPHSISIVHPHTRVEKAGPGTTHPCGEHSSWLLRNHGTMVMISTYARALVVNIGRVGRLGTRVNKSSRVSRTMARVRPISG